MLALQLLRSAAIYKVPSRLGAFESTHNKSQEQRKKLFSSNSASTRVHNQLKDSSVGSQGNNFLKYMFITSAVLGVGVLLNSGLTYDSMGEEERRAYGYKHDANESIVAIANPDTQGKELVSYPIYVALQEALGKGVKVTFVFPDPNDLVDNEEKLQLLSHIEQAKRLGAEVRFSSGYHLPYYGDVIDGQSMHLKIGGETVTGKNPWYLEQASKLLSRTTSDRLI